MVLFVNLEKQRREQVAHSELGISHPKFHEANDADLQRQLYDAKIECWNYVQNYDEFRSESAVLAPEASFARSRIVSDFKHGNGNNSNIKK